MSAVVVKVGGSLFDLPNLIPVLSKYLDELPYDRILIVPGGGASADVVRELDRVHNLGEELAHEIALTSLLVTNHFLRTALKIATVPSSRWYEAEDRYHILPPPLILDAYEVRQRAVLRTWDFTSDSLAACAAVVAGCPLIVLKSTDDTEDMVDPCFWKIAQGEVSFVNFRAVVLASSPRS